MKIPPLLQILDSVEILEPETMTWGAAPAMPTARADHCVVRHRDEVYVVGGTTGTIFTVVLWFS